MVAEQYLGTTHNYYSFNGMFGGHKCHGTSPISRAVTLHIFQSNASSFLDFGDD